MAAMVSDSSVPDSGTTALSIPRAAASYRLPEMGAPSIVVSVQPLL
jgi:hypothetical protein